MNDLVTEEGIINESHWIWDLIIDSYMFLTVFSAIIIGFVIAYFIANTNWAQE
mgnify:CR=1 FL=1